MFRFAKFEFSGHVAAIQWSRNPNWCVCDQHQHLHVRRGTLRLCARAPGGPGPEGLQMRGVHRRCASPPPHYHHSWFHTTLSLRQHGILIHPSAISIIPTSTVLVRTGKEDGSQLISSALQRVPSAQVDQALRCRRHTARIPPVCVPRGKANMGEIPLPFRSRGMVTERLPSGPAGPAVEFGSIKDVNDGPPISPSPPPVAAIANVVAPKVNGNTATTSIDHPRLTTLPSTTPLPPAQPPATPKLTRVDIKQFFQNPSSSTIPTSHPLSESTSPAVRPLNLPQQQPPLPQHQSLPSSTPPSTQQPSQLGSHPYTFAPTGGLRPQQQNTGPGGGPGSGGPRSPGYSRQMANGAGPRPPAGSKISSGGAPPMSSPRLAPHHVLGQATTGPSPQPIPAWPPPYHVSILRWYNYCMIY